MADVVAPIAMEDVIESAPVDAQEPPVADEEVPDGPKPTETIYIQNLNEKIRIDGTHQSII